MVLVFRISFVEHFFKKLVLAAVCLICFTGKRALICFKFTLFIVAKTKKGYENYVFFFSRKNAEKCFAKLILKKIKTPEYDGDFWHCITEALLY